MALPSKRPLPRLLLSLLLVALAAQLALGACSKPNDSGHITSGTGMDANSSALQDTLLPSTDAKPDSGESEPSAGNATENAGPDTAASGNLMAGSYLLNAPCHSQTDIGAIMGCEGAALLSGLHVKGSALGYDLEAFLAEMPIASDHNPHHGFGGSSAYVEELLDELGREVWNGIFPAPLAEWGRRYGNVVDLSGASAEDLVAELAAGNPSVVYITPFWDGGGGIEEWWFGITVAEQHVVLLDGYDGIKRQYHICDPEFGTYWVDSDTFIENYNLLNWAVVVR